MSGLVCGGDAVLVCGFAGAGAGAPCDADACGTAATGWTRRRKAGTPASAPRPILARRGGRVIVAGYSPRISIGSEDERDNGFLRLALCLFLRSNTLPARPHRRRNSCVMKFLSGAASGPRRITNKSAEPPVQGAAFPADRRSIEWLLGGPCSRVIFGG